MPNLVVVVVPDLAKCHDVLDLWESRGVSGVTILESVGLYKLQQARAARDDLPLIPSLRHLMADEEYHHRTAFVVVDDDFDLDGLIEATERLLGGDFNAPHSGILFVMSVTRAFGIHPHWKHKGP